MTELDPARIDRVTASGLPKLLGLKGTPEQYLREKVREHFGDIPDFISSPMTDWGNEHEAEAIVEYELTRGSYVTATGANQRTVIHPEHFFLAATPDGLVAKDGLVEVKCPWRAQYSHWSQRPDIEAQIRGQLACTGRAWCDLVVWRQGQPIAVSRVEHDPAWLTAPLYNGRSVLDHAKAFLDRLAEVVADETLAAPYRAALRDELTSPQAHDAAEDLEECQIVREAAEKAEAEARQAVIDLANATGAKTTRIGNYTVTRSNPSGSVAYKKALEKYAPDADLSPFTSEPKGEPTWTVRRSK